VKKKGEVTHILDALMPRLAKIIFNR